MVDVDVMEAAKHPLSLFIDSELEAQVFTLHYILKILKGIKSNYLGVFLINVLCICDSAYHKLNFGKKL